MDLRMALEWLDTHFIFTPEQLKKINERKAGSGGEPLGPHGSARPNQQTIADLRDHKAPQVPILHRKRRLYCVIEKFL